MCCTSIFPRRAYITVARLLYLGLFILCQEINVKNMQNTPRELGKHMKVRMLSYPTAANAYLPDRKPSVITGWLAKVRLLQTTCLSRPCISEIFMLYIC